MSKAPDKKIQLCLAKNHPDGQGHDIKERDDDEKSSPGDYGCGNGVDDHILWLILNTTIRKHIEKNNIIQN